MTTYSVTSGLTSSGITLHNGDFLYVSSGGTAISTTVDNGGTEVVYSGGAASYTMVSDGGSAVVSGGTAAFTAVSNGGTEVVSSGGVATFTTVSNGGSAVVSNGGAANFTTISFGGTADVYSGGTTSFTTVSGGSEHVYSGGAANFTTISHGGTADVYSGGTTSFTTVRGGTEYVYSGGTASYTTVSSGGLEVVSSGGRAISTTVSSGGFESLYGGATSFTTVSRDGAEQVNSGGTTFSTTLSSGGGEYVASAGTTVDTTVDSGGFEVVSRGLARAIGTTVNNGGSEYVLSHGRTSGTMLSSGGLEWIFKMGTAISTTVGSGGDEIVAGGSALYTVVDAGGTIDAAILTYSSGGSATVNSSNLLMVSVGGQSYTQQLSGDYTGVTFTLGLDAGRGTLVTAVAPCYRSGTRIMTDRGEVAVEDLRVGDLVRTVLGESVAPIIWIGRREVDCARHPKPRQVWPVCVAAGAFGPGRPHTELFLSPDHAVYVGEVLIPIRHLINASTIAQVPVDRVSYYHFELPQHDVVLAQGLPAESFLDLKDGSNYANRPGPVRLYPDYTARMWEAYGCAKLVVTGPELVAARTLIASFAGTQVAA